MGVIDKTKIRNILISIFLVLFSRVFLASLFQFTINLKIILLIINVVIYFILFDPKDKKKLPINAFFMIIIFGSVISVVKPVQYGLDEESHLPNVISISDSPIFKYSNEKLEDYNSVFKYDALRNPSKKDKNYWFNAEHKESKIKGVKVGFDNPAFIPSAIGWNIGRLISKKVYVSYYLGRIFEVIAFAILVFIALKISKVYREAIYLFATFPAVLYIIAGYHYDYLYFGASLIALALLTNVLSEKNKVDKKYAVAFQCTTLLFAFSKFPFILTGSLLSVLPNRYYKDKNMRSFSSLLFLLNLFISFVYVGIIKLFPSGNSISGEGPGLFYFLTHPLPLLRTLFLAPHGIINDFISDPLKYVSEKSAFLIAASIFTFFFILFIIILRNKIELPKFFKYYSLLLLLGIAILIIVAISGDPRVYHTGDIVVGGVQGRYYYYILMFLPLYFGTWFHKKVGIADIAQSEDSNFDISLQYALIFLNILTISIGIYTQIQG
ncbi:DUF2142 domain-containing protein [Streptococcus ilei]|uniref:DUF2142 domain-containing protein n=1 Tax=Streptococcus ilei TaxID=1156431 RepID=UPI0003B92D12|nr:DUF2142 domain-containing protein [Streptococcus ilei]AGY39909.1 membrane protein [Streptococcus ilei]